jgi:rubrerythrin
MWRKHVYVCQKCGHKFESKDALEVKDRICGICRLEAIYGRRDKL